MQANPVKLKKRNQNIKKQTLTISTKNFFTLISIKETPCATNYSNIFPYLFLSSPCLFPFITFIYSDPLLMNFFDICSLFYVIKPQNVIKFILDSFFFETVKPLLALSYLKHHYYYF